MFVLFLVMDLAMSKKWFFNRPQLLITSSWNIDLVKYSLPSSDRCPSPGPAWPPAQSSCHNQYTSSPSHSFWPAHPGFQGRQQNACWESKFSSCYWVHRILANRLRKVLLIVLPPTPLPPVSCTPCSWTAATKSISCSGVWCTSVVCLVLWSHCGVHHICFALAMKTWNVQEPCIEILSRETAPSWTFHGPSQATGRSVSRHFLNPRKKKV